MTKFEEELLSKLIIHCDDATKIHKNIINAIGAEFTYGKCDEFKEDVLYVIENYLKTITDDKQYISNFMEENILPQLLVGNYSNIITDIRYFESRYTKEN